MNLGARINQIRWLRILWSGLLPGILSAGIVQGASAPVLTVNGVNADYTTTHIFVDEVIGDSVPLTISFSPNTTNVIEADVFSNLNSKMECCPRMATPS